MAEPWAWKNERFEEVRRLCQDEEPGMWDNVVMVAAVRTIDVRVRERDAARAEVERLRDEVAMLRVVETATHDLAETEATLRTIATGALATLDAARAEVERLRSENAFNEGIVDENRERAEARLAETEAALRVCAEALKPFAYPPVVRGKFIVYGAEVNALRAALALPAVRRVMEKS